MKDQHKAEEQQIDENTLLRRRIAELEALEAEHKRVEDALRESEERFHKIFDHSNDAIFIVDPTRDVILDVNPRACRMLGYSREELLSLPLSAIHPDEMPQLKVFAQSVFEHGKGWTDELTCLTKSNEVLPSEISASIIDLGGKTCMIALVRDVTERKQAEEALVHLASFPEHNPNPVVETDLNGNITYLNPLARERFPDLEESGLQHALLEGFGTIVSELKDAGAESIVREIEIGDSVYDQKVSYVSESGSVRIFAHDITERKRAEEAAEAATRAKNEFLEKELQMAHDMQMGLLPTRPIRGERFEIAGRCVPANHVGGDYFNYFWLDEAKRYLGFGAADVSGKAMAAAVRAMQLSGIFRYEFLEARPLREVLQGLHEVLQGELPPTSFVTCCLGTLDVEEGVVQLANAAHPFPYHYSAATGMLEALQMPSLPLGIRLPPGSPGGFAEVEVEMGAGDFLVLYSDGVTDMQDETGGFYESERLETLNRECADVGAEGLVEAVLEDLKRFRGTASQKDDVTLLVLRAQPEGELSSSE